MKLPSSETLERIRDDPKRWPAFVDCIGALDGSHFLLHCPEKDKSRFRNRHGDLSQNVLACVDFDMNFVYVLAGWEGFAHDGRVIRDAQQKGFEVPEGRYYVADAGYNNCEYMLVPYRGVRYHLREITAVGRQPENKQELFNMRHSSLRNVVERVFGVFKRRWRIFDRPHEFDIKTQVKLVYTLTAVHNHINVCYAIDIDWDEDIASTNYLIRPSV